MGTTAEKLQKIEDTKAALGAVISSHGGTVPQTFAGYPAALEGRIEAEKIAGVEAINDGTLAALVLPTSLKISTYICFGSNALTSVDAPLANFIESNAFRNCSNLRAVNLPNVQTIDNYVFYGCASLEDIDLPKVTQVGSNVFNACRGLKRINLPLCTSVGSNALLYCSSLETLLLPKLTTFSTSFGAVASAANGCPALTSLTLPAIATIPNRCFGYSATQIYTPNLTDLYIPNKTVAQVKAMANYATWYLPTSCTIHCSDGNFNYGS